YLTVGVLFIVLPPGFCLEEHLGQGLNKHICGFDGHRDCSDIQTEDIYFTCIPCGCRCSWI
ncbi:hypothetical protein RA276_32675, partial [Pseudomonas syringae pv. tagetis]|uniref:hypothetical protein n=1 Tax=Pseudomonas syringae group genomosp. 7 TaxID=251699 RepID=UPI003770164F